METIREITAIETFSVRHPILRPGKPVESCHFDGDNLNTTKHFGIFKKNELIGVISLFESKNNMFSAQNQFQIRGMAVLEIHQKKGHGEALVYYTEEFLKKNKDNPFLIWFNAREKAVGFYQKLGYTIIGDSFDIFDVGIHYVMYKSFK
ncbi:MAG TPA: GNAT family N-acetyltransferase [Flavobacterium sp.]|nr:GNAT family N-acetyltransferase [Flavobacterium sp.]